MAKATRLHGRERLRPIEERRDVPFLLRKDRPVPEVLCASLAAALGRDAFLPPIVIENVVGEVVSYELLKFTLIQAKADPIGDFRSLRILYLPDGDGISLVAGIVFWALVQEGDFV